MKKNLTAGVDGIKLRSFQKEMIQDLAKDGYSISKVIRSLIDVGLNSANMENRLAGLSFADTVNAFKLSEDQKKRITDISLKFKITFSEAVRQLIDIGLERDHGRIKNHVTKLIDEHHFQEYDKKAHPYCRSFRERRNKKVVVSLSSDEYKILTSYCKYKGKSSADIIRQALIALLTK